MQISDRKDFLSQMPRVWTVFVLIAVFACYPAVAQVPKAPEDDSRPAVRGHVYSADTGRPLKHAVLTLTRPGSTEKTALATTGGDRAFRFPQVPPGIYLLRCERNGYIGTYYGGIPPQPLSVRAGEQLSVDFRLQRGGAITGIVLGDDGDPLPDVSVEALFPRRLGKRTLYSSVRTKSDDRGIYRLARLPAGQCFVRADAQTPERAAEASFGPLPPVFYPNVLALKDAGKIEVKSGAEVRNIDFRMMRVPAFHVSGSVVGARGQPPGEATVLLEPMDFSGALARAEVRQDGSFSVTPVLPARYRASVYAGRAARPRSGKMIDVSGGNIENLLLELSPGAEIKGRVIFEGGSLPAGHSISLFLRRRDAENEPASYSGTQASPPDFEFRVPSLSAGEYEVSVSPPFMPAVTYYLRELRANRETVGLVRLAPDSSVELQVIVGFDRGSLSGTLRSEDGRPLIGGAVVHAADPALRKLDRYFLSERTDQNGCFTFSGLAPGEYILIGWPAGVEPDLALEPEILARLEQYAVRVRVRGNANVEQDAKLAPQAVEILRAAEK